MNPFRRRLTIVLVAVGAIGAIAAIATAASLALFYDPTAPAPVSFATGNVTLNSSPAQSCTFSGLYPGAGTPGEPEGDLGLTKCTLQFDYTGTLNAYLGLDVSVTSTPNNDPTNSVADCNGGNASGTQPCLGLYNPSVGAPNNEDDGIQVNVDGTGSSGGIAQAFGIGNDQTIWESPTTDTAAASSNYTETYTVDLYWPLDTGSTVGENQNAYTGATANVTLTEHSVQAADNPLNKACGTISDAQPAFGTNQYYGLDQPTEGWGAGFNSGAEASGSTYPTIGGCPTVSSDATSWNSRTLGSEVLPFYHPDDQPRT